MTTPAMISHHQLTPPPQADPNQATIKMEDLLDYSRASLPPTSHPSMSTPPPENGKPKKRKSWGQVLPEPKTNLPPRKRAKTEDEKEQRRIERVKRNRLAAHNSRERKRQEVELLQAEKDRTDADLRAAHATIARMAAQLKALSQRYPTETIDLSFEASSPSADDYDSLGQSDTICPRQTSFPSPVSMDSMDSPRDESCQPETPGYTESVLSELDQTRYPAAILCDLQCQSSSEPRSRPSSLQATLAFLILFNLTLPSMRSLWTTSSASTSSQTTMWSNLLTWLTRQQTSSLLPSTQDTLKTPTAFLTHLMQSTSTCRQLLAQLTLATKLSQRRSSSKWIARPSGRRGSAGLDGVKTRRMLRSLGHRQSSRRKGISSLEQDITRLLGSSWGPKFTGSLQGVSVES